jgi:ankyrin repeat protein
MHGHDAMLFVLRYVPGCMLTALHLVFCVCCVVAMQGHDAVLQLLLQRGCIPNVNVADKCGSTALHTAAAGGHLAAVQLLLQAGAAVDACASANATALHCAAAAGLVMCPDAAAAVKERIRSQDSGSSSSSSSTYAHKQQQQEYGRWPGLLVDIRSCTGSSSNEISCNAASPSSVVAALLAAGASTAVADAAGWLPLHWAVARGCSRTVQHLLEHDRQQAHSSSSSSSSSNAATTAEGWSPLHLAVMLGQSRVVQQLLQHPGCQVRLLGSSAS